MKYLYCGYVKSDLLSLFRTGDDPVFEVTCIKVLKRNEDHNYTTNYTTVDGFYFVGSDISFESIPDTYLDKELNLKYGKAIYSFDKQKCIDFVNAKYKSFKERVDRYIRYVQKAQKCQVTISKE